MQVFMAQLKDLPLRIALHRVLQVTTVPRVRKTAPRTAVQLEDMV